MSTIEKIRLLQHVEAMFVRILPCDKPKMHARCERAARELRAEIDSLPCTESEIKLVWG